MNAANCLTLSRLVIASLILLTFYQNTQSGYVIALALVIVAIISDVLDGFVARRFNQTSDIGAKLDPLVDKIMIHSLLFSLFYVGVFGPVLVFAMFFRDMIVDGLRNVASDLSAKCGSNVWGKVKFVLQSLSACSGLIYCIDRSHQSWAWLAEALLTIAFLASLPGVAIIISQLQHDGRRRDRGVALISKKISEQHAA